MTAFLTIGSNGNVVGVGIIHILPGSVGVGSQDDGHLHFSAFFDQIPQWVGIVQPGTSVVQGNICWIESNNAPRTQQYAVGTNAPEL